VPNKVAEDLLLASRAQLEAISHDCWLIQELVQHSRDIIAHSQSQIERLDAHVAKLDPGAGLSKPKP